MSRWYIVVLVGLIKYPPIGQSGGWKHEHRKEGDENEAK